MNSTQKAYAQLHLAVLLFGFTAILGACISLSAFVLVWWRVFLTSLSLLFLIGFGRKLYLLPRKLILQYMGIGIIVGLHWVCFFGSIKYANASISLICMATISLFTSFLEPLLMRTPFRWYELAIGIVIIPAMVLIANSTELAMLPGIWVGLLSAFLAALFSTLNKKMVEKTDPLTITFLELGSACLFLGLLLPIVFSYNPELHFTPTAKDFFYLIILALGCTTFAYVLSLTALKYVSAFASNLVYNLEPVYGIILAIFLLQENKVLNMEFYMGCALILCAVFSYPFIKNLATK